MEEADKKIVSNEEYKNTRLYNETKQKQKLPRFEAHDYENKIQELLEKIEILENQIKLTTDQKLKVVSKLKSFEDENDLLKDQIARQQNHSNKLKDDISKLSNKVDDLVNQKKAIQEKSKTKVEILNKEIEEKQTGLEKLMNQVKEKDDSIKYYTVNNDNAIRFQNYAKEELESEKNLNKGLNEKIKELEKIIDELYRQTQSTAALQLEVNHLKEDNLRLLKMLKTTEEFKDFAYLEETVPGNIRFIRESSAKSLRPKSSARVYEKSKNSQSHLGENWIPSDAYSFAVEFKNKHNLDMSENLINDLLSCLNKIWREREQKQINRIKSNYQGEVMALRRKLANRSTFDEFTAKQTITKLKKDLRDTRDDLRNNVVIGNKIKSNPSGIDLVENALKVASSFQQTKKCLENEISSLKNKLNEKDMKHSKETNDVVKFNEGSFWIISRAVEEIANFEQQVDELYSQYQDRVIGSSTDVYEMNLKVMTSSMKWFYTSLKELIESLKDKIKKWKFDAQKNFDSLKYA